jgi:hypothetical protein
LARRRAKPRWLALGGLILLALGLAATAAFAVHDAGVFELDDNAFDSPNDAGLTDDWDSVYSESIGGASSNAENISFDTDIFGAGDNIFTGAQPGGSSKDPDPLSGWRWVQSNSSSAPDKDDLEHAYTAQYIVDLSTNDDFDCGTLGDVADCDLLYFGADRYAVSGDAQLGFWFFREEITLGPKVGNVGAFVGDHTARTGDCDATPVNCVRGDLLVLSDFLQGGSSPTIRVFEWVGSGGTDGSLDLIAGSVTTPADCNGGPPPKQNATPVPPVGSDDNACATVNAATTASPWSFTPKAGTADNFPAGSFYEGGINLTALGFGDTCFSSFLAETRSSQSPTATLKDFVLGGFGDCDSSMSTTPSAPTLSGSAPLVDTDGDSLEDIQLGTGDAGAIVVDSAHVEVTGIDNWSGTVDFFICGPIASPELCDEGGVAAGADIPVDQDTTDVISSETKLTEVGRYCWRGEFTPSTATADAGVDPASDATFGECFEVLPVTPTLSTQAVGPDGEALTDDVPFGTALYDEATLSGTAYEPGDTGHADYPSINATMTDKADGTITFVLYIDDGNCDTPAPGDPDTANEADVDGDGTYLSDGFTTDNPGDFTWQAVYDGSTSGNTLGTDHNLDCADPEEDVTVEQLQPTMSTAQRFVPNDQATVTVDGGAGALDGTVTFYLFVDDETCGGGDLELADYTSSAIAIHADDAAGSISDSATSGNTTEYTSNLSFYWVVVFESSNNAHLDVKSDCIENSSITIDNG